MTVLTLLIGTQIAFDFLPDLLFCDLSILTLTWIPCFCCCIPSDVIFPCRLFASWICKLHSKLLTENKHQNVFKFVNSTNYEPDLQQTTSSPLMIHLDLKDSCVSIKTYTRQKVKEQLRFPEIKLDDSSFAQKLTNLWIVCLTSQYKLMKLLNILLVQPTVHIKI